MEEEGNFPWEGMIYRFKKNRGGRSAFCFLSRYVCVGGGEGGGSVFFSAVRLSHPRVVLVLWGEDRGEQGGEFLFFKNFSFCISVEMLPWVLKAGHICETSILSAHLRGGRFGMRL